MNAFIISNKNNDVLIAASNAGCELYDHTTLMLCDHMTQLLLTPQCAGCGIKQVQLRVI